MGHLPCVRDDEAPPAPTGRQSSGLCLLPPLQAGAIFEHRFEPEPMSLSHMIRSADVSAQALLFCPEVIARGLNAAPAVPTSWMRGPDP